MPPKDRDRQKTEHFQRIRQIGILTAVPFILPLGPLIGFFLGRWLDRRFGTEPVLVVVLIALGFAASVRETVRMIRDAMRQS